MAFQSIFDLGAIGRVIQVGDTRNRDSAAIGAQCGVVGAVVVNVGKRDFAVLCHLNLGMCVEGYDRLASSALCLKAMSVVLSTHAAAPRRLSAVSLFHEFFLHSYQSLTASARNQELFHVKFWVKSAYVIITIIT